MATRKNITPEGHAYRAMRPLKQLATVVGLQATFIGQEGIPRRIGKVLSISGAQVGQVLSFQNLPDQVMQLFDQGMITFHGAIEMADAVRTNEAGAIDWKRVVAKVKDRHDPKEPALDTYAVRNILINSTKFTTPGRTRTLTDAALHAPEIERLRIPEDRAVYFIDGLYVVRYLETDRDYPHEMKRLNPDPQRNEALIVAFSNPAHPIPGITDKGSLVLVQLGEKETYIPPAT